MNPGHQGTGLVAGTAGRPATKRSGEITDGHPLRQRYLGAGEVCRWLSDWPAADRRRWGEAGNHRCRAMEISDQWVAQGMRSDSPLLAWERTVLVRSYTALLAAIRRRTRDDASKRGGEL